MRPLIYTLMLVCGVGAVRLWGQGAYTPEAGKFTVTPSYTYQTFDRFYNSKDSIRLRNFGIEDIQQHAASVSAEYGITNDLAVDVTLGYVIAYVDNVLVPGDPKTIDGLNDTLIGLRYRLIDEARMDNLWTPTLTARLGAILSGTYRAGFINSPGDGAFGIEPSLLAGRYYEGLGLGYYASSAFRVRFDVPDEFVGGVGIYKVLFNRLIVSFGYQRLHSISGVDFDSPDFRLDRFQELREESDTIKYGIGYLDPAGNSYNLNFGNVLHGKNVGESFIIDVSATIPF
ncbi:MAG: hypothetical protein SNJ84_00565 [Verrucomicrobiia bacterium]